ncbi:MAG: sulfate ABC transporter permease subunit [Polyangiales bacterium]
MSLISSALRPNRAERAVRWTIVVYVILLVAVPLAGIAYYGLADGVGLFWERVTAPVARSALGLSIWTGLLVGLFNTVVGTAAAWVLVRYPIPGRSLLTAAVDLPLAIPTLVAGVMLVVLYGPTSLVGEKLSIMDVEVAFARPGIVLALMFVTFPFVVRAVEPVLSEIDPAEEEAAIVLGAGPWKTFRTVFVPAIMPAALSGGIRSVGRALGEFGSIVVIAGNIPFETLTGPVFIFGEIESGSPKVAAAVSAVLLLVALALHGAARIAEAYTGARHAVG